MQAQEAPASPEWDLGLAGRLSASQSAYNNWQEGGLNIIALTSGVTGVAGRETANWIQAHELRLAYGFIRQDTLGFRKADDLIRLGSSLQYKGAGFFRKFRPTAALMANTQLAPGYNYDEAPEGLAGPTPVKVSDFFSPAVLTQTLGLTYQPSEWFIQRLGLAAKETIVSIERLRPLYGLSPEEAMRFEVGLETRSELEKEVFTNVFLASGLTLFAAFNNLGIPDVRWENLITMAVNSWLGVNLEFVTLYDRDISDAVQIKEVLSLGITVVVL